MNGSLLLKLLFDWLKDASEKRKVQQQQKIDQ